MTDGGRRLAFGTAAACIAIVVAIMLLTTPQRAQEQPPRAPDRPAEPAPDGRRTAAAPPRQADDGGARQAFSGTSGGTDVPRTREEARRPTREPRARSLSPAARATATAFLQAFLRYEAGVPFSSVRGVFARHAADDLVRRLRDAPPRVPRAVAVRPPTGWLETVGPAGEAPEGRLLVTARIVYERQRSEMLLTLRRVDASWRVEALR